MKNRLKMVQLAALACLLVCVSCRRSVDAHTGATPRAPRPAMPREKATIELTGVGLGNPRVFTYDEMSRMEMTRLDNILMNKTYAPDETSSWRGPKLDVLLAAAEVKPGPMWFTLTATDGYEMRCSREDARAAIVALQDGEGRWLADLDKACPQRLVMPEKTADYWVMNLARVTVEPMEGQ